MGLRNHGDGDCKAYYDRKIWPGKKEKGSHADSRYRWKVISGHVWQEQEGTINHIIKLSSVLSRSNAWKMVLQHGYAPLTQDLTFYNPICLRATEQRYIFDFFFFMFHRVSFCRSDGQWSISTLEILRARKGWWVTCDFAPPAGKACCLNHRSYKAYRLLISIPSLCLFIYLLRRCRFLLCSCRYICLSLSLSLCLFVFLSFYL